MSTQPDRTVLHFTLHSLDFYPNWITTFPPMHTYSSGAICGLVSCSKTQKKQVIKAKWLTHSTTWATAASTLLSPLSPTLILCAAKRPLRRGRKPLSLLFQGQELNTYSSFLYVAFGTLVQLIWRDKSHIYMSFSFNLLRLVWNALHCIAKFCSFGISDRINCDINKCS